jgi:type IV pilus assembly protein PilW
MIALGVSTAIALSAMRLIAQSNADYQRTEQLVLIDDQAGHALDLIAHSLQQAGHVDAMVPMPAVPSRPFEGAVIGIDNSTVATGTPAIDKPVRGAHLGSDVLVVRFAGDASGRVSNCAGFTVAPSLTGDDDRGISIFYVALDSLNEPELRCKYRGSSQWTSQAIAAGVESFQVLYGIDTDGDGLPNDFVSASGVLALEAAAASTQPSIRTRVVAVELALLFRSPQPVREQFLTRAIDLFGQTYADRHATDDPGTRVAPSQLKPNRLHRRYSAVIFLNNSLRPDA